MPVTWTVSTSAALVVAVAQGELKRDDIERYLDSIHRLGAMPFRKIFDATAGSLTMGIIDVQRLGSLISDYTKAGSVGPIAIVTTSAAGLEMAEFYARQTMGQRHLKIFRELHEARKWLDEISPMRPGASDET